MGSKCVQCGTIYEETVEFLPTNAVRVAKCRVCPVNNVYSICERCADINKVAQSACPWCGARNFWEIREMKKGYGYGQSSDSSIRL